LSFSVLILSSSSFFLFIISISSGVREEIIVFSTALIGLVSPNLIDNFSRGRSSVEDLLIISDLIIGNLSDSFSLVPVSLIFSSSFISNSNI